MPRYDQEHKAQTRQRILQASDRLMKKKGVEAASIEAVMREAGLTVGGFYAHFSSKEVLASETLLFGLEASVERLLATLNDIDDPHQWVRALIEAYLAQSFDPALERACPLTLLLPEVARGDRAAQNAFAQRTASLLDRVALRFPDVSGMTRRDAVLAVFTSCAGAVALARAVPGSGARRRIVRVTQAMLLRMLGAATPTAN